MQLSVKPTPHQRLKPKLCRTQPDAMLWYQGKLFPNWSCVYLCDLPAIRDYRRWRARAKTPGFPMLSLISPPFSLKQETFLFWSSTVIPVFERRTSWLWEHKYNASFAVCNPEAHLKYWFRQRNASYIFDYTVFIISTGWHHRYRQVQERKVRWLAF